MSDKIEHAMRLSFNWGRWQVICSAACHEFPMVMTFSSAGAAYSAAKMHAREIVARGETYSLERSAEAVFKERDR